MQAPHLQHVIAALLKPAIVQNVIVLDVMINKEIIMTDCCDKKHPDHSKQIARMNKVSGQVNGIKQMILDNRYCPEILIQLRAVRSAVRAIEANILQRHLATCVTDTLSNEDISNDEKQIKIDEIIDLFKKYEST